MALTLTNRAQHMIIVELNNGESVYLTPGQTSRPIDEGQVSGNEKISKLTRLSALSINQPAKGGSEKKTAEEEEEEEEEEIATAKEARSSNGGKRRSRKG